MGRIVDNSVSLNIRALNYGNSICTKAVKWEITAPLPEGQWKLCAPKDTLCRQRVALCRQRAAIDRRSRQPEGGIMQPEGGIMFPEGLIISIGPRAGRSNHIII